MEYTNLHSFGISQAEMEDIQRNLFTKVQQIPLPHPPKLLSGFDVSYSDTVAVATLVTFDSSMNLIEEVHDIAIPGFAYVPGFLGFREIPYLLRCWKKATIIPDVVLFDGNGILHPRGVGEATHASFFIGCPTLGLAKTPYLVDMPDVGPKVGDFTTIELEGRVVAAAVRTMKKANPVIVSVGNWITLEESVNLVLQYPAKQGRLSEITHYADQKSRQLLAEINSPPVRKMNIF